MKTSSLKQYCLGLVAWLLATVADPSLAQTRSGTASGVPGGIAEIALPDDFDGRWQLSFNNRPLAWRENATGKIAMLGIPLSTTAGTLTVMLRAPDGNATPLVVMIEDKQYREQRITLSNNDYVSPKPKQLERINRERKAINAAIRHYEVSPPELWQLIPPVDGRRSSSFGLRRFFNDQPRKPHSGMDIAAAEGTPISAPLSGKVVATGDWYFNGQSVVIHHGRGLVTLYCHLSEIGVVDGQRVKTGEDIGRVGSTGRVTGAHLHWGVYLNGTAIDPALLLSEAPL